MMQKIEKVLDLAVEALSLYVAETRARHGAVGDVPEKPAPHARKAKAAAQPPAAPEAPAPSPFSHEGNVVDAAPEAPTSIEDAVEIARVGKETMGLFIRRYIKASPTGLQRAEKIIVDTLGPATKVNQKTGKVGWALDHFTSADWLKLTPKFAAGLDAAEAELAGAK